MEVKRDNPFEGAFRAVSTLVVEGYTWLMAVSFGMILLDILYARVLRGAMLRDAILRGANAAVDPALIFSDVSDLILWIGGLSFMAAIAAIGVSWRWASARNLFAASLLVVIGGAMIPVAVFILFPNSALVTTLGAGWWIRLGISGVASLLAFLGLRAFHKR